MKKSFKTLCIVLVALMAFLTATPVLATEAVSHDHDGVIMDQTDISIGNPYVSGESTMNILCLFGHKFTIWEDELISREFWGSNNLGCLSWQEFRCAGYRCERCDAWDGNTYHLYWTPIYYIAHDWPPVPFMPVCGRCGWKS